MNKKLISVGIIALMAGRMLADEGSWADSLEIKGDLRLRHEMIDDDSKDETRNRQRVRAPV